MSWSNKNKIEQNFDELEILTPDGHQILVGTLEDQVLIYQAGYSNWGLKSRNAAGIWGLKPKTTGIWSLKTKIEA